MILPLVKDRKEVRTYRHEVGGVRVASESSASGNSFRFCTCGTKPSRLLGYNGDGGLEVPLCNSVLLERLSEVLKRRQFRETQHRLL
jgi:hypothetical protein